MRKIAVVLMTVVIFGFAQDVLANGGGKLTPPPGMKDPNTALILSAIAPGAGQFYNDQLFYKGLFMGALEVLGWVLVAATEEETVGLVLVAGNHVVSAFDAYIQTSRINQGLGLKMTPEGPALAFSHRF